MPTDADASSLAAVLAKIDDANAKDPSLEASENGEAPAALLYGRRMSETLEGFKPDASEHLQIAVRGQHIERWTSARADYPDGKAGYLDWRRELAQHHASRVGALMAEAGYAAEDQERVGALIRKEGIKRDPEAQALEDVAALTFMRWYFEAFAAKHPMEKVLDIVAKTARKMSVEGRAAAAALPLPPEVAKAVSI